MARDRKSTVRKQWSVLKAWMNRELTPVAGQDGTAEMWAAIDVVDIHIKATTKKKKPKS